MTSPHMEPEDERLDPELRLKLEAIERQAADIPTFPNWKRGFRMLLIAALPVWFVLLPLLWMVPLGVRIIFLMVLHLLTGVIAALRPER